MTAPGPRLAASSGSSFALLGRTLALLEIVALAPDPQTLSDLARRINAPKTTTLRLLTALVQQDTLERNDLHYSLGETMQRLSRLIVDRAPKDIVDLLAPFAGDLFERTGDFVTVGIPDGGSVAIVHTIRSHRHRALPVTDDRLPMETSAIGKLWLAENPVAAFGPSDEAVVAAAAGRQSVLAELRRIRQTGVATAADELANGVVEIAMPVVGSHGLIAGIARVRPMTTPSPATAALVHHQIALAASAAARRFEMRATPTR